ncbi:MAG: SDR family NAD(P)-dependent oxidoreductase [Clostridiales bacterium]|nr:SDR family NAD(P)-dependent oxidoreductase [Clostridiales bacterium]
MNENTVLVTGGATGIGYSMAKNFHGRGNTIIICGRREDRLEQAAAELPGIHTFSCDVSIPDGREALFRYVSEHFPKINILINNAGIQCDIDLTKGMPGLPDLMQEDNEIRVNFVAPIYLSALFTPLLAGKDNAAIVNVSSGLAFMVEHATRAPIYCATKAGMHAFSIAQRAQLAPLGIRVIEMIPPMVESELNLEGRRKRNMVTSPNMMSSDQYVEKAFSKMEEGIDEIRLEVAWKQ